MLQTLMALKQQLPMEKSHLTVHHTHLLGMGAATKMAPVHILQFCQQNILSTTTVKHLTLQDKLVQESYW